MKRAVLIIGWIVIAVSILVMFGWFFDVDILKRIVPGFVTMKFATAFSFLLGGLIFLFTVYRERTRNDWASIVIPAATLIILIVMGTTLFSVVLNFESGIEDLFVVESIDAVLTPVPGQASVGTMIAFILIAVLGIFGMTTWHRRFIAHRYGGFFLGFLGILALTGYIIDQPFLYYTVPNISSAMAIHTAVLFVILGIGYVLFSYENQEDTRIAS